MSVKVTITAINQKTNEQLVIVKRGNYGVTKAGIKQALMDGYADKYKTTSPNFDVTDVVQLPARFRGERLQKYAVAIRQKPLFFGRTIATFSAQVIFKAV